MNALYAFMIVLVMAFTLTMIPSLVIVKEFGSGEVLTNWLNWRDGTCKMSSIPVLETVNASCACHCRCSNEMNTTCFEHIYFDQKQDRCDTRGCDFLKAWCDPNAAVCSRCHYWHYKLTTHWIMSDVEGLSKPIRWVETKQSDDTSLKLQAAMYLNFACSGIDCEAREYPCSATVGYNFNHYDAKPPNLSLGAHRGRESRRRFQLSVATLCVCAALLLLLIVTLSLAGIIHCRRSYFCCAMCCKRIDNEETRRLLMSTGIQSKE